MTTSTLEDQRRTAGIAAYDLLERPPRRDLVALVELAALVCDVPMATINLITDVHQHQVAAVGFDASVCRREDSMCAAVLDADTPIVVTDARLDPRFQDNPFVTGAIGDVRFYASHKLVTPAGIAIGTLCVFDTEPRALDTQQVGALATLADRVVDVLELSLTTKRLAETLSQVEDSNQRLASFAGQVSHDLKSPLTSVTMSLELVHDHLTEGADPQEARWLVDRALQGSQRMALLIDDVLDFARVSGSLKLTSVDLGALLGDVRVDLESALADVRLEARSLPTVPGDQVQLRALLQNLVGNAAKFRVAGRPPVVRVGARPTAGGWRIEVTDNGPGVPAGDRERVFLPLARAASSVDGSGIGLATCRRIVEAHGGAIGLDEADGGGTVAWFELPQ
ncbi:sensor histidine kinase [Nocardioides lijunqiniae]|uniref:sensor histidine kinase n=1 Tax=Nocardioides lijunqiniae TaxID=2760832 RepID=UPI00187822C1|nr:GAF domain-containing sensor histidine kinase [Nocardioides lijunqiniae]